MLVSWPEENAITPVLMADVKSPAPSELHPGVVCTVKYGSRVYEGTVAAIGKCVYICTCVSIYTSVIMYTCTRTAVDAQYITTCFSICCLCKKEMLELSRQFESREWSPSCSLVC